MLASQRREKCCCEQKHSFKKAQRRQRYKSNSSHRIHTYVWHVLFYSPHNVCRLEEILGRDAEGRWTKAQTKEQPSLSKHEHEQSFICTNLLVWKTHKKCINSRRCTTQKSHHHKHTYTHSIVLGSIFLGSVSFSSFHSFKRLFSLLLSIHEWCWYTAAAAAKPTISQRSLLLFGLWRWNKIN